MVAGGGRGGQTRSGGLGQGSKKPAKGSAVALRDAWRHRMAKHGFATPWQLPAARALRNEWRRLAVTTPDERDDPLCAVALTTALESGQCQLKSLDLSGESMCLAACAAGLCAPLSFRRLPAFVGRRWCVCVRCEVVGGAVGC
jgi:hypothetical protein